MMMYMPTKLYCGDNCLFEHAADVQALGASCLVVTGAHSAKESGALADIERLCDATDIAMSVWDTICENPSVSECVKAGRFAAEKNPAFIIGAGGGSALDAAKAVAVFAANPTLDEEAFYAKAWAKDPVPIVLVGTTAGTGSEVTKVSVLTDSSFRKHSIHDEKLFATLSFGDSRYTCSCPASVTLSCGVDVVAHAIESYFSRKADEISRAFAVRALRLAYRPLVAASSTKTLSKDERQALYEASILAGLAINTTGTCFPHNLGYYLTETYNVPHGFACAAFLPQFIARVSEYDSSYANDFVQETGISQGAWSELIEQCSSKELPQLSQHEIDAILPRWENNASVQNTRADISLGDVRDILQQVSV